QEGSGGVAGPGEVVGDEVNLLRRVVLWRPDDLDWGVECWHGRKAAFIFKSIRLVSEIAHGKVKAFHDAEWHIEPRRELQYPEAHETPTAQGRECPRLAIGGGSGHPG